MALVACLGIAYPSGWGFDFPISMSSVPSKTKSSVAGLLSMLGSNLCEGVMTYRFMLPPTPGRITPSKRQEEFNYKERLHPCA